MMRQRIVSARDFLGTQDRIVLVLACKHVVSVTRREVTAMPPAAVLRLFQADAGWDCAFCPDPPAAPVLPSPAQGQRSVYYAHCMAIYGTLTETRDVALLESLGWFVVNPNTDAIEAQCSALRREVQAHNDRAETCADTACPNAGMVGHHHPRNASDEVMVSIFKPLAQSADVLVFRALPDGMIPSGVAQEVAWAIESGVPVMEIPSGMSRRVLTLAQTREYLTEAGQR